MLVTLSHALVYIFMTLVSIFLILIVLIQRGKGGGLVGAFGGMGGNAFGTKTTDVFVKITVWTAVIWFVACFVSKYVVKIAPESATDRIVKEAAAPADVGAAPTPALTSADGDDAAAATSATLEPAADSAATSATPATAADSAATPATPAE